MRAAAEILQEEEKSGEGDEEGALLKAAVAPRGHDGAAALGPWDPGTQGSGRGGIQAQTPGMICDLSCRAASGAP